MKIIGYQMLNPGSTRGAVSDTFYRWLAGQVYDCPAVPVGEFAHMDPAICIPLVEYARPSAPQVVTGSIDPNDIETRPVAAKRGKGKTA